MAYTNYMAIPTYIVKENVTIPSKTIDSVILPAGAFVKPIEARYLPQHILNSDEFKNHKEGKTIFVYCRLGIILVPANIVIQI